MSSTGPLPVTYDPNSGAIQYPFGLGFIAIPEASVNAITSLTGDVTATGPGSTAATIAAGAVTTSKIASGAITAALIASGAVTPAKISTTGSDDFTFPRDVTVTRNLSVVGTTLGVGVANAGNVNVTFGGSATPVTTLALKASNGSQTILNFNSNGDKFGIINNVTNLVSYDWVNNVTLQTMYAAGGVAPTMLTTTAKNALTAVSGMVVYDTTLNQLQYYNGTSWTVAGGSPAGADTQVQFNNAGAFGASSNLHWDGTILYAPKMQTFRPGHSTQTVTWLGNTIQMVNNGTLIVRGDSISATDANLVVADQNGQSFFNADSGANKVSIGAGLSADSSAIVHIDSTTAGFIPPRMDTTARDAIASPAEGLVIYNLTTHKLNVFTTLWEQVTSA